MARRLARYINSKGKITYPRQLKTVEAAIKAGRFLDPCFVCFTDNCTNSHEKDFFLYRAALHKTAVMALGMNLKRMGPGKYKPKVVVPKRKPGERHYKYVTFTPQEMKNIRNYKPHYLPTHEEQILNKYGY
jgi:hypothetical protein